MPDATSQTAEHIAYEELERYALNGSGAEIDMERIEAHLASCTACRESYEEEEIYMEVMRAALSAFNCGGSLP
jgi:predicted anti-sigma-YlaC factor YlaD